MCLYGRLLHVRHCFVQKKCKMSGMDYYTPSLFPGSILVEQISSNAIIAWVGEGGRRFE